MVHTYSPASMEVPPDADEQSSQFRDHEVKYSKDAMEPIAIIGLSFKFPQEAISEDSFWDMIVRKRCASTDVPKDRMNVNAFFSPDTQKQNTVQISCLTEI